MDQVEIHLKSLENILSRTTPEYLKETSLTELKHKLVQAHEATERVKEEWESVDISDYPDSETIGWETKKQEAIQLRDEIKALIQPRISELEKLEAKSELAGAEAKAKDAPNPSSTTETKLHELQQLYNDIKTEYGKLEEQLKEHSTPASIPIVEALYRTFGILHGSFLQKYMAMNKATLTSQQSATLLDQKAELATLAEKARVKQNEKIEHLKLIEKADNQRLAIEEKEAAKTKAEREAQEAIDRALEEKDKKEKAEKERDEKANQLQQAILDAEQRLTAEQTSHQTELERLQRELKIIRDSTNKEKELANKNVREMEAKLAAATQGQDIFEAGPSRLNWSNQLMISEEPGVGAPRKKADPVMTLKLDTIELPYFNGDLTEWDSFKDYFSVLVHENSNFSNILKFHQLRTHLKGAEYDTIKGYKIDGANYEAAWTDLKIRYDRKEELIQEYIRKFLEVPAIINRATFTKLRTIIDVTNQMIRALPNLGVEVSSWDPFISMIISSKLDEFTRYQWKEKQGRTPFSVIQLIDFLELRAIELQPSQGERLSQMLRGDNNKKGPPRRIFQINEQKQEKSENKKECHLCKGQHRLWNCDKLKSECAKVRTEMLRTLRVCFKCLLKHEIGLCDQEDCSYCGGPHHILLCYKKENDAKWKNKSLNSSKSTELNPKAKPYQTSKNKPQKRQRLEPDDDWDQPWDNNPKKNPEE